MEKLWESQKSKRAQKTQMLGGMPKSQEKNDSWNKMSMSQPKQWKRANQRRTAKKKKKLKETKSRTADNDP